MMGLRRPTTGTFGTVVSGLSTWSREPIWCACRQKENGTAIADVTDHRGHVSAHRFVEGGDDPPERRGDHRRAFGWCNDLQPTCEDYRVSAATSTSRESCSMRSSRGTSGRCSSPAWDTCSADPGRRWMVRPRCLSSSRRRPSPSCTVVVPRQPFPAGAAAFEERFERWPAPGLARLPGTWLGDLPACYVDEDLVPPGQECPDDASGPTIGDITDAYLFVGD